jgi:hypothetical protein
MEKKAHRYKAKGKRQKAKGKSCYSEESRASGMAKNLFDFGLWILACRQDMLLILDYLSGE